MACSWIRVSTFEGYDGSQPVGRYVQESQEQSNYVDRYHWNIYATMRERSVDVIIHVGLKLIGSSQPKSNTVVLLTRGPNRSSRPKRKKKKYKSLPPKIPAHHHSHDITPASYNRDAPTQGLEDASEGLDKRSEVTKSAREARRKAIKESNFLRGL